MAGPISPNGLERSGAEKLARMWETAWLSSQDLHSYEKKLMEIEGYRVNVERAGHTWAHQGNLEVYCPTRDITSTKPLFSAWPNMEESQQESSRHGVHIQRQREAEGRCTNAQLRHIK